jgi:hypothetical protein
MYAILSLWIANLRVGRFQALFAFAVGFGIAALSVPLALFPDGLTLLAHEVRPGLAPMEQVGLVVVAGYFLALAIGLGLAGGTWFGAMIFAGGLAASWSDKRAKPLALGTMFGGWLVISGAALVFQLTEPDYTFFPKGIAFFWGAVLTLSCLGLLWVTLALVLRTKW